MWKVFQIIITLVTVVLVTITSGIACQKVVVSKEGKGDFRTIQAAIASLNDSSETPRVVFIRKGVYREKIYIEKDNVVLEGEDREVVIITYPIAREEWRCSHLDDWGAATLNIDGDDITIKNITVVNSYGTEWQGEKIIHCPTDTGAQMKTITRYGHQMAIRTMMATRFKAINCHILSYAGDTVSPWNVNEGMFFFKDCTVEGGVDLYCPRGWAYAEGCRFIARRGDAILWHDGSRKQDSRTVLNNCSFEGYDGFQLGRYHRDAQFYLVNCTFASNMADKPIYRVATSNTIQWGHRVFYYNCHKMNGDFPWFADNLATAPEQVNPSEINAAWVFGNKWDPLK